MKHNWVLKIGEWHFQREVELGVIIMLFIFRLAVLQNWQTAEMKGTKHPQETS